MNETTNAMASQATAELPKPAEWALQLAAQAWCEPTTSAKVMDEALATVFAQILTRLAASFEDDRASRAQSESTSAPTIAGALFDFMGFLTTHETRWKFSAYDNASPAVEALEEWAAKRGLSLDEANVSGWRTATTLGETK